MNITVKKSKKTISILNLVTSNKNNIKRGDFVFMSLWRETWFSVMDSIPEKINGKQRQLNR